MSNAKTSPGMSVRSALILTGMVGIAALIVSVKGTPHSVRLPSDDDLHENVTLSVLFTPQQRKKPVQIQASVDGVVVVPPTGEYWTQFKSPFNQVIRVPKGARISLYALQEEAPKPGNLDCVITNKEGTLAHGYRNDVGSVRCYVNRVGG